MEHWIVLFSFFPIWNPATGSFWITTQWLTVPYVSQVSGGYLGSSIYQTKNTSFRLVVLSLTFFPSRRISFFSSLH
ncbi:hypothetical protein BDP55DRAFT_668105 [Colletotrichum godetiae]|uniref:Uncharacterized protein n=1 Tax=Colletotrichum godetiae TaxID=1209918 RepID=A0AAJ0EWG8_9PEZI|nr:uncharacterized protein BDP55DRAFT_668105 [Colletotrichum godetiae]KAK1674199.1 hypothetical protein BDP55DRAFT_668105 [Colletotrichum godetiae]